MKWYIYITLTMEIMRMCLGQMTDHTCGTQVGHFVKCRLIVLSSLYWKVQRVIIIHELYQNPIG